MKKGYQITDPVEKARLQEMIKENERRHDKETKEEDDFFWKEYYEKLLLPREWEEKQAKKFKLRLFVLPTFFYGFLLIASYLLGILFGDKTSFAFYAIFW